MSKKTRIRGEKLIYDRKEEILEVCQGCAWKPYKQSCLLWKYLTPELCKEIREELAIEG